MVGLRVCMSRRLYDVMLDVIAGSMVQCVWARVPCVPCVCVSRYYYYPGLVRAPHGQYVASLGPYIIIIRRLRNVFNFKH